ncbi:unnamed protein product, partial [Tetraodon nigroviridis]
GQTHYLPPGKEYVVGRKNCDVLLTSDQSISRAHAQLVPNNQGMTLKDSSKYGTFVNSQRLTGNTAVDLKSGDSVTFGVFESKFIVEHLKPVVCSSCLDPNGKAVLSQSLAALGGELVNSWSLECTHLVMTSVKVTVKLKRLSAAVGFGGGRSLLLEEGSLPRQLLECPQSCLIDVTTGSSQALAPSSTTEWAKAVKNVVQRKGLRVIPESEIGLAAIYASCDRHCNPSHHIADSGHNKAKFVVAWWWEKLPRRGRSRAPVSSTPPLPEFRDRPHVQSWTIGERSQQRRQADRRSSLRPDWKEELNNRKRKEMEEDIEMDELESIMSLDMDFFDELPAESHQAQTSTQSSHEKKHSVDTAEASSASKRPRLHFEDGPGGKLKCDVKKESHSEQPGWPAVSIKTEEPHLSEHGSTYGEASKRPQTSSSTTHTNTKAFEDDEDLQRPAADIFQPEEETKIPMKAVTIKQEVQAEIDENLPKQLVVVEYRSLTVAEGPKEKPQKVPDASCKKNFKSFRKHSVPGMRGSPDVIAGADLLVHNRGRNSDLDEWLKDAIEEERQSRRDENVGDDLFR